MERDTAGIVLAAQQQRVGIRRRNHRKPHLLGIRQPSFNIQRLNRFGKQRPALIQYAYTDYLFLADLSPFIQCAEPCCCIRFYRERKLHLVRSHIFHKMEKGNLDSARNGSRCVIRQINACVIIQRNAGENGRIAAFHFVVGMSGLQKIVYYPEGNDVAVLIQAPQQVTVGMADVAIFPRRTPSPKTADLFMNVLCMGSTDTVHHLLRCFCITIMLHRPQLQPAFVGRVLHPAFRNFAGMMRRQCVRSFLPQLIRRHHLIHALPCWGRNTTVFAQKVRIGASRYEPQVCVAMGIAALRVVREGTAAGRRRVIQTMRVKPRANFREYLANDFFSIYRRLRVLIFLRQIQLVSAAPQRDAGMVLSRAQQHFSLLPIKRKLILLFRIQRAAEKKILPEENSAAVTFLIKGFRQFICFAPNAQHIAVGQLRKVKDSCHFLRGIAVRQGVQMHEVCTPHPHRHSVHTEEKPIADVNLPEADKPGNIFVFGAYRQRIASRCAVRPRIPAFRLMDRQGEPLPAMRSCPRSVGDNCSMRIRQ